MQELYSVARGAWLGFSIAAPVGPIGLLVLKRTLREGRAAGWFSGLGAALADLIYGMLAVAGVSLAADFARPVALVGGAILLWLAWQSWREPAATAAAAGRGTTLAGCVATTFLLTLSNPMTILVFAAMVASAGGGAPAWFVLGVFLGSMLWWTILSAGAHWSGAAKWLSGAMLSRLSAVTLACFGVWAIWHKGVQPGLR